MVFGGPLALAPRFSSRLECLSFVVLGCGLCLCFPLGRGRGDGLRVSGGSREHLLLSCQRPRWRGASSRATLAISSTRVQQHVVREG
eukprot:11424917-Alexandrium_andersonii.AAC.1